MIISSGTELLRYYQQRYHINHIPAEIIPVPVDSNVFFPADRLVVREKLGIDAGVKIVLYAGRFEKVKNLDLLLETFRLLQMQLENAVLWLVGEGEEKSYLQKKAAKLVLTNVKFFNTLSSVQLAEFMNAADVLAVTSLHESGPLVVKEALACNLPVVSVDVGDVMEVVRDLEGCLVVGYEKREFAEGLEKVIGLGIRSGLRGRVEKFGVDEFGRKLGIVYGEVIGGG
jgi:glycosyltransferase involved in cell wall biosynthesis